MHIPMRALAVLLLAAAPACASGRADTERAESPRARFDIITAEEIERGQWSSALDMVSTLRPQWLRTRGTDSFGQPGEVRAYFDGTRLRELATLRELPATGIVRVEYVAPIAASARWGLDHGNGAILIFTRPE